MAYPMTPLRATLHELGLRSDDPARLADFYSRALGYRFDGQLGTAHDRRVTIVEGLPRTLAYAAYAVPEAAELDAIEARLSRAGAPFERIEMAGFEGSVLAFRDPDGNGMRFGVPAGDQAAPSGVSVDRAARVQHVVFASTDLGRALTFYTDVVGFILTDRVEDEDGGLRTFFVSSSHEHHSLAFFLAKENRLDHHCYEAGDWALIRDWADHFAKLRIPLKWGPGRHGPGSNLFLFIHDPDGNWLEISAELEHVAPGRPVGVWPHEEYTLNTWGVGLLRS